MSGSKIIIQEALVSMTSAEPNRFCHASDIRLCGLFKPPGNLI